MNEVSAQKEMQMIPNYENSCGECRECCIHLPIYEPDDDLVKAAGVPCKHLCNQGCSLFKKPEMPSMCQKFLCEWRDTDWFRNRPDYRPDRLGVIFHIGHDINVTEVRSGALDAPAVRYILAKLKKWYPDAPVVEKPFGVTAGVIPTENHMPGMEYDIISSNHFRLRTGSPGFEVIDAVLEQTCEAVTPILDTDKAISADSKHIT
jgi:hypothetical protein